MSTGRTYRIAVLPGDGIGPEVSTAAVDVLQAAASTHGFGLTLDSFLVGGAALDDIGDPLPASTRAGCLGADAVFLGAVGGPKWEGGPRRPEDGLLQLRKLLDTFANLRPVTVPEPLASRSPLREEIARGTDILIVRELTGGVYFGEPRVESDEDAFDTMRYRRGEVTRIAQVAVEWARRRSGRITSVDKANVLASSRLWRKVVSEVASAQDLELDHMYVDNAAMQLVRDPRRFDVILTGNLFGDVLSDIGATLTGSLGMLPSASIGPESAIFEPVHGSAPDIGGSDSANPIGAILSAAMMLDHLGESDAASAIRAAVGATLEAGILTADLATGAPSSTSQVTAAVINYLNELSILES